MKKVYSLLGISILALSLAACDNVDSALGMYSDAPESSEESVASSSSSESASLNAVSSESSSSSEESSEAETATGSESDETVEVSEDSVQVDDEEVVDDTSVASEAANAQAMTTEEIEESIIAAQPETSVTSSEAVPSSEVEDQMATESANDAGNFDNIRARELLAEAAPLISADSQGAYQSDEYFFLPTLLNEELAQVDVYRQSPDGQGHSNLIATYRYDATTGTLMVMDVVSGTWQNTGQ